MFRLSSPKVKVLFLCPHSAAKKSVKAKHLCGRTSHLAR